MAEQEIVIRKETPDDIPAIRRIHLEAFDYPYEANLVDALREEGAHVLSMVADRGGRILGHILYSPVSLVSETGSLIVAGLAPMAVYPRMQRTGIGKRLIRESLAALREESVPAVVLLGHPEYYPKFGFQPASRFGITYDFKVPDNAFMALELEEGALTHHGGGVAKYHPAFIDVQFGFEPE